MGAPAGSLKPGEFEHRITEEALDADGYVLSAETGLTTTDGNVKKATSTYYVPFGVNIMSSDDPTNPGTAIADIEIAIAHDGIRDVQLAAAASRTTSIVVGDLLAVYDAGKVAHVTDCAVTSLLGTVNAATVLKALHCIVGTAEEAVLETVDPSDGKIKCRLCIK